MKAEQSLRMQKQDTVSKPVSLSLLLGWRTPNPRVPSWTSKKPFTKDYNRRVSIVSIPKKVPWVLTVWGSGWGEWQAKASDECNSLQPADPLPSEGVWLPRGRMWKQSESSKQREVTSVARMHPRLVLHNHNRMFSSWYVSFYILVCFCFERLTKREHVFGIVWTRPRGTFFDTFAMSL